MKQLWESIRIFDEEANIVSLKFKNPEIESEFNRYYITKYLWQLRLAHVLAVTFYFVAVLAEDIFLKDTITYTFFRIIFVGSSFFIGLLITFYFKSFYIKYYKIFSIYYVLITSFSFIFSGSVAPVPYTYSLYSGLIVSLIFNYTFIRQDFVIASATGFVVFISYLFIAFSGTQSSDYLFHVSIYIGVINFLGMFIAYSIEHDARKSFLMMNQIAADAKEIKNTNKKLESQVKERTSELNKAKLKAEESDRLKTAFLLNLSHEIRTPLNGIMGFTELLNDPENSQVQQRAFIDKIQNSGDRLTNTVTNLIEISKVETGQIEYQPAAFDARQEMKSLVSDYEDKIKSKGLLLKNNFAAQGDDLTVNTDRAKFDFIVASFIKNAIKYTREGIIEIGATTSGRKTFFVKDTGVGIPAERQEAIFRAFEQADIEDKDAMQGTGIELTISNAYAKVMGCEITLESEVGEGSNFYLHIPG